MIIVRGLNVRGLQPICAQLSLTGVLTALAGLALLVWVVRQVGVAQIEADLRQVGWGLVADHRDRRPAVPGARARLAAVPRAAAPPAHRRRVRRGRLRRRDRQPHAARPARRRAGKGGVRARPYSAGARGHRAGDRERLLHALGRRDDRRRHGRAARSSSSCRPASATSAKARLPRALVLFAVALWLLWRQPALVSRALSGSRLQSHADGRATDRRADLHVRRPAPIGACPPSCAAEASFHALGVAEVHLTLWLLRHRAGPAHVVHPRDHEPSDQVVFKFVPLRLGVDEAGTAVFTQVLGLGSQTGVTLAIVRKARDAVLDGRRRACCWCAKACSRSGRTNRAMPGQADIA